MRLLLVEDERILADTLNEVLTLQGHTVEVAYRGDHGWELACGDPYDVLILDWMLPGLSGIEICQRLRNRQYAGSILLLTARDTGEIFGLQAFYPILNGIGLIGLLVTGLSMSGLFDKKSLKASKAQSSED